MLSYITRRVLATIPVVLMVALFVFSLLYIAPGDPAAIIAGDQATPSDVERIRASLGLDRPFLYALATGSGTCCTVTWGLRSSPICRLAT